MAARGKKLLKVRRRAEFKHKKFRIKTGDRVQVICGDHRDKIGNVLSVDPARERVVVEGVNMIFKHVKKTQQNPQGGRVEHEAPIHISNVALYDEGESRWTRTRYQVDGDKKVRVSVRSGNKIGD